MEQKTKSLLKSRKVIYSISTLVVSLVVVILPRLNAGWTPEQLEMFKPLLLGTIALGLALLGGHTLTDMTAIKHSPPQYKDLTEAVKEALEVIVTEVDPESDLAEQLKKLFEDVGVDLS